MDERARVSRLFAWDAWANRETLASLERAGAPPRQALGRFAHLLATEHLWFDRLQRRPASLPVWPAFDLARCASEVESAAGLWPPYLGALTAAVFESSIDYVNSKGERFESRVADVLLHVVTHGSYHRGQIAADLRASGAEPAYTDYVHATRLGLV